MFLRCSYFLTKSEADVLINSVLIKRKACIPNLSVPLERRNAAEFDRLWFSCRVKIRREAESPRKSRDLVDKPNATRNCPTVGREMMLNEFGEMTSEVLNCLTMERETLQHEFAEMTKAVPSCTTRKKLYSMKLVQ